MLCLGHSNYFRFNHPEQAMKLKEATTNGEVLQPRGDVSAATHHLRSNGGRLCMHFHRTCSFMPFYCSILIVLSKELFT